MIYWLKVGEYEYIYTNEITLKKKSFRFKMAAIAIFDIAQEC